MTRTHKVMALLAGLLLMAMAGCSSYTTVAKKNFEIEPDVSYGVLVGKDQMGTLGEGTVFLFFGSMSITTQSSLRMGYTTASGKSYILDVPMKLIEFRAQDPSVEPSAQFKFLDSYPPREGMSLQDLIDSGLSKATLTITPEQYKQLITG